MIMYSNSMEYVHEKEIKEDKYGLFIHILTGILEDYPN